MLPKLCRLDNMIWRVNNKNAKLLGKTGQKVSDDVRDRIRATSSIGDVWIVSLGCGEVLGTHEPTRFNHNGPLL